MEKIIKLVEEKLKEEDYSHNIDHILRVKDLSLKLCDALKADKLIVTLASLLHDVDDYKIVGVNKSKDLTNAKNIMTECNIDLEIQSKVLNIIKHMGYKNSLKGIRPTSIEGMIVSDADMLDGLGVNGIIRSITYAVSEKGNKVIFNKEIFPNVNISFKEYNKNNTTHETDGAINHLFEKTLKLPNLILTEPAKVEANKRKEIVILFLKELFREENVPQWEEFLNNYLKENNL